MDAAGVESAELIKIKTFLRRLIKVFRSNGKVFLYDMALSDSGKSKKPDSAVEPRNTLAMLTNEFAECFAFLLISFVALCIFS